MRRAASNRTGTGGRRGGLLADPAVGQCRLQFGDARVGDVGGAEVQRLKVGQSLEMRESGVGDLGVRRG